MPTIPETSPLLAGLALKRDRHTSLQRQLFDGLREAILGGRLPPGARLPATRRLAAELSLGRNTVIGAYEQLAAEGYVEARTGQGTRVAALAPESLLRVAPEDGAPDRSRGPRRRRGRAPAAGAEAGPSPGTRALSARGRRLLAEDRATGEGLPRAFQPGLPALDRFPFARWSRLLGRHARDRNPRRLGYEDTTGLPELRRALAEHVSASRGVRCGPDQVLVVCGAQAALDLAARLLLDPGDEVWVEDPGYLGARGAMVAAGARLAAVPVDSDGLRVAEGARRHPHARLVYVTPSHQYPLGVTLSLERRLELLRWAEQRGAWILEDDYDSEYRFGGRPLTALQGLDGTGRVIYVGTLSKTMLPSLRLAYLVVPDDLIEAFAAALRHTGQWAPSTLQAAMAEFISEGHFGSHLRRMRALYAARREHFVAGIESRFGERLTVVPTEAGMQLCALLAPGIDDLSLSAAALRRGVVARPLAQQYLPPARGRRKGLLLGFAGIDTAEAAHGLDRLAAALDEVGKP